VGDDQHGLPLLGHHVASGSSTFTHPFPGQARGTLRQTASDRPLQRALARGCPPCCCFRLTGGWKASGLVGQFRFLQPPVSFASLGTRILLHGDGASVDVSRAQSGWHQQRISSLNTKAVAAAQRGRYVRTNDQARAAEINTSSPDGSWVTRDQVIFEKN